MAETIEMGTVTAESLRGQTQQMEQIVDHLDEIHFSMKKSMKLIRDLTRGLATDRCILVLLFIVVVGRDASHHARLSLASGPGASHHACL